MRSSSLFHSLRFMASAWWLAMCGGSVLAADPIPTLGSDDKGTIRLESKTYHIGAF